MGVLVPKILVVEGDAYLRGFLTRVLRECGCTVEAVTSYEDGLRLSQITHFSLCVVNEVLPDGSGVELCRQVHALHSGVPIVICYSKDGRECVAVEAGAQVSFKIGDYISYQLRQLLTQLISMGVKAEQSMCTVRKSA